MSSSQSQTHVATAYWTIELLHTLREPKRAEIG
jgi:hypothetical protein